MRNVFDTPNKNSTVQYGDIQVNNVEIFNSETEYCGGFALTFDTPITGSKADRERVETIVKYYCSIPAITQSEVLMTWEGCTLIVTFDSRTGHFKGDLTHHDAIYDGDDKFPRKGLLTMITNGLENSRRILDAVEVDLRGIYFYGYSLNENCYG